jgi:hypothetical protein
MPQVAAHLRDDRLRDPRLLADLHLYARVGSAPHHGTALLLYILGN